MSKDQAEIADKVESKLARMNAGDLLAKLHLPRREMVIAEWDDMPITLRGFTVAQADGIAKAVTGEDGRPDRGLLRKLMFQYGVMEPSFSPEQVEQLWELAGAAPVQRVLDALDELNGEGDTSRRSAITLLEGAIAQLRLPDDVQVDVDRLVANLQTAVDELKGRGPSSRGERLNSFRD